MFSKFLHVFVNKNLILILHLNGKCYMNLNPIASFQSINQSNLTNTSCNYFYVTLISIHSYESIHIHHFFFISEFHKSMSRNQTVVLVNQWINLTWKQRQKFTLQVTIFKLAATLLFLDIIWYNSVQKLMKLVYSKWIQATGIHTSIKLYSHDYHTKH